MLTWIRHNQGTFVGIILCVALVVWGYGCESKVQSLMGKVQVTRGELRIELDTEVKRLEAELDTLQQTAQLRFESLDRQDTIKAKLFDTVAIATQEGNFNHTGIVTLAGSILAVCLGVDNRIKDKVIKNRPLPINNHITPQPG